MSRQAFDESDFLDDMEDDDQEIFSDRPERRHRDLQARRKIEYRQELKRLREMIDDNDLQDSDWA